MPDSVHPAERERIEVRPSAWRSHTEWTRDVQCECGYMAYESWREGKPHTSLVCTKCGYFNHSRPAPAILRPAPEAEGERERIEAFARALWDMERFDTFAGTQPSLSAMPAYSTYADGAEEGCEFDEQNEALREWCRDRARQLLAALRAPVERESAEWRVCERHDCNVAPDDDCSMCEAEPQQAEAEGSEV